MQLNLKLALLSDGCGHPDLGGHCNEVALLHRAAWGAATLISSGHCKVQNKKPGLRCDTANLFLGGHCN